MFSERDLERDRSVSPYGSGLLRRRQVPEHLGSVPEREPEKQLVHLNMASGAYNTQFL